jgi:hypothetical protein
MENSDIKNVALKQLYKIKSDRFRNFYGTSKEDEILMVVLNPVEKYIIILEWLNEILSKDGEVELSRVPSSIFQVSLREFLTSEKGEYLDTEYEVTRFLTAAELFIRHMERVSSDTSSFNSVRNARLLNFTLLNIYEIVSVLYTTQHL